MDISTEYYAKIGRKAVRAGLEMANDIIVNVLRDLDGIEQTIPVKVKRGRPRTAVVELPAPSESKTTGRGNYWASMTAEERSAEMARRHKNRRKKIMSPAEAAAFRKKLSKLAKRSWKKRKADPTLVNGHAAKEATVRQLRGARA